jgi:hypothetical protein
MNQINLDKLLRLSAGGKADSGSIKLVLAQVYQAQLQQLPDGGARLQLGAGQTPLQLTLTAAEAARLQPLLQPGAMSSQTRQPASTSGLQVPVQLQFTLTTDNQIQLNLQSSQATQTLALSAAQVRQLLAQFFLSSSGATPVQSDSPPAETAQQSAALVSARLLVASPSLAATSAMTLAKAGSIQLPSMAPLPIAKDAQQQLNSLLQHSHSNQLTVLLQLNSDKGELSARLVLPGNPNSAQQALLDKPQQQQLLQQLVQLFNQQRPSTLSPLPLLSSLKLPTGAGQQFQLHLQQQGKHWQLQLQPANVKTSLTVDAGQFNRPLQLVGPAPTAHNNATATAQLTSDTITQAWRHLLPVLPLSTDPLASLPELPEPVQQLLQAVRHSQLDGAKVVPVQQLVLQLLSLLQFQPLQSQASMQTSGGTLAVAIQLLLGHLLQKPVPAAQTPANQRLSQLVSALEPQQASNLLRQLASHSSTLQQSQLASLDSNAQAQQQLILQLPLQQGGQSVFSQIQLEQREADSKQDGSKQTLWQLTMRFDLQQLGAMLVIARLQQQQLQLQFYTEQPQALALTEQFLPILKDRCNMQGLDVQQAECVLGKIPESLLPRANSLLAIKV